MEFKNHCSLTVFVSSQERQNTTVGKYLETTRLIKRLYLKYIKNPQISTVNKKAIQLENGQKK